MTKSENQKLEELIGLCISITDLLDELQPTKSREMNASQVMDFLAHLLNHAKAASKVLKEGMEEFCPDEYRKVKNDIRTMLRGRLN